jgi:hypothetical protein
MVSGWEKDTDESLYGVRPEWLGTQSTDWPWKLAKVSPSGRRADLGGLREALHQTALCLLS